MQGEEGAQRQVQEGGSVVFVSLLYNPSIDLGEFDWD